MPNQLRAIVPARQLEQHSPHGLRKDPKGGHNKDRQQ